MKIYVDRNKHIIDQTYDYLKNIFNEINFLPIHLLKNAYPIKSSELFYSHYSSFTLSTDNDELFELLSSVEFNNEGIKIRGRKYIKGVRDLQRKLEFIISILNCNLVFNLRLKDSNKVISIRKEITDSCNCISCYFNKLDFHSVFSGLNVKPKKLKDRLVLASINYKLGNYVESARHYTVIANISHKNSRIRYAISQYNLSKLYVFIKNNYWKNNKELLEQLKSIDLDSVFQKSKTEHNKDLLNWILHTKFYSISKDNISKTVGKIRDHYFSQKKGGWSSNNYVVELINEYATIDTFLNSNYIIFDNFSEYQDLTNLFVEGLICSFSMNERQTTKIQFFDDWIIQRIVFHGMADEFIKYCDRYEVNSIKYQKTVYNGSSFIELIDNFLLNSDNLRPTYENFSEKQNRRFWINYNKYFSNLLILIAYCDLDCDKTKDISNKLLHYLQEEDYIYPLNMKYVRIFLSRKGQYIDKDVLFGFIQVEYKKEKFHNQNLIKTAIHEIKNQFKKVDLSNQIFSELLSYIFDDCTSCGGKHDADVMLDIYNSVDDIEIKKEIHYQIQKQLQNKFDSNLYYLSVMTNVIVLDQNLFKSYIDAIKPRENQRSFESIFSDVKDTRFHQVNNLLDICFKYDVDLTDSKFDDYRMLDVYYEWLFNMDKYDYSKFNPIWTYEYWTIHYIAQYRKHPLILKKVIEYLDKTKDNNLERIAYELFKNTNNNAYDT